MRAIFISYRRGDAEGQAGRLFSDLVSHFGKTAVFMDVEDIEPGRDFRKVIDQHVSSCGVLLALVGKGWLNATDNDGHRRLDDPNDFVRLETATALKRDIPVIPVLVQGATMPKQNSLPADLMEFAFRNAVELTHARWESDVQLLIKALSPYVNLGEQQEKSAAAGSESDATSKASGKRSIAKVKEAEERINGSQASRRTRKMAWIPITITAMVAFALVAGGYVIYYNTKKAAEDEKAAAQKAANERAAVEKVAREQRIAAEKAAAERIAADKALKKIRDEENSKIDKDRKQNEAGKKRVEEENHNGSITNGYTKRASLNSEESNNPKKIRIATTPNQSPSPANIFPAGIISDDQDSVQILDVTPKPGSYLHRGKPQVFKIKMLYSLCSQETATLSMGLAQKYISSRGYTVSNLIDATDVNLYRGKHIIDINVNWSGDLKTQNMKGNIIIAPSFWRFRPSGKKECFKRFDIFENLSLSFGP